MSFIEVIVEEVISDPSVYNMDVMRELVPKIKSDHVSILCDEPVPQPGDEAEPKDPSLNLYYLRAPRNTVIGRPLSETTNPIQPGTGYLQVFYPFFSSHLSLPVKPGESVWVFESGGISYWVTRVSQPLNSEDPNFTHPDRKALPVRPAPIKTTKGTPGEVEEIKVSEDNEISRIPNFPNGHEFKARATDNPSPAADDFKPPKNEKLYPQGLLRYPFNHDHPSKSQYEIIYEENRNDSQIQYEPVPRITKKPGDMIIQGSNNSSIVLGVEDGSWDAFARPDGTNSVVSLQDASPASGMIDLVAGRGRIHQDFDAEEILEKNPAALTTRPRVIKNIRENVETDKNVGLDTDIAGDGGHLIDAAEGDPDFVHDASRVFVSMKSVPDDLLHPEGYNYPKTVASGDPNNTEIVTEFAQPSASIIVKSDEVRIVARKKLVDDPITGSPEINGSIKIIKEGVEDEDQACIMMQPDGTILIDSPKVVITGGGLAGTAAHGAGTQLSLGRGATEPIVLGHELVGVLTAIINVLDNHIHPSAAGPTSPRSGGYPTIAPNGGFTNKSSDVTDLQCILSKLGKTL